MHPASGAYINRMSDYCRHCRFDPWKMLGEGASPFSYLYWDFLMRNEAELRENPRMVQALQNLARKMDEERGAILKQAQFFLQDL